LQWVFHRYTDAAINKKTGCNGSRQAVQENRRSGFESGNWLFLYSIELTLRQAQGERISAMKLLDLPFMVRLSNHWRKIGSNQVMP